MRKTVLSTLYAAKYSVSLTLRDVAFVRNLATHPFATVGIASSSLSYLGKLATDYTRQGVTAVCIYLMLLITCCWGNVASRAFNDQGDKLPTC
jgi:hypothetical protein